MNISKIFPASIAIGCAAAIIASPLPSQATLPTTARFHEIVVLAQNGQSDSARSLVTAALQTLDGTSQLYPEALYTAGTVAASGDDAKLFFSRVAVEYPLSDWADKALLRLAQLDYGRGEMATSVARIERLMTDYPNSTVFADAALWGSRAAMENNDPDLACSWLDQGLRVVGDNIELRNQMEFARRSCDAGQGTVVINRTRDSLRAKPEPAPPSKTVAPPAIEAAIEESPVGPWRVQVAALKNSTAIRRVEKAILDAGLRVYREAGPNGLTKLQAGPFDSREQAQARVEALGKAVGSKPFVVRID